MNRKGYSTHCNALGRQIRKIEDQRGYRFPEAHRQLENAAAVIEEYFDPDKQPAAPAWELALMTLEIAMQQWPANPDQQSAVIHQLALLDDIWQKLVKRS